MKKRQAFTLVELLIVIGIIAALISILIPAMASARHQAKTVQCLANLRTLQLAFVNYVGNENDGRAFFYVSIPPTTSSPAPYSSTSWLPDLRRAGAPDGARMCPEAIDLAPLPSGQFSTCGTATLSWTYNPLSLTPQTYNSYSGSYAFNGWLYGYNPPPATLGGVTSSGPSMPPYPPSASGPTPTPGSGYIQLPKGWKQGIPLFCDSIWVETFPTSTDIPAPKLQPTNMYPTIPNGPSNICIDRHHRAINVIFLDGSAATTPLLDLWSLPWSNNYGPPTASQLKILEQQITAQYQ